LQCILKNRVSTKRHLSTIENHWRLSACWIETLWVWALLASSNLRELPQNCLGDLDGALEHYQKALEIQEQHVDQKTESSKHWLVGL
jgi:hypothetical protein